MRYASGIDRGDWQLFRSCFTDDCVADYQDVAVWRSSAEITDFMREAHAPCTAVIHRITNLSISPNPDGSAAARSYVDAILLFADDAGLQMIGYYDDRVVRTADGWKIAERRFSRVLHQPVTPIPAT